MRCLKCEAKWQVGNIRPLYDKCPICEENYINNPEQCEHDSIIEVLQKILIDNGIDVALDKKRINGLLNDYFPKQEQERAMISDLLDKGVGEFVHSNYHSCNEGDVDIYVKSLFLPEKELVVTDAINFLTGSKDYQGSDLEIKDFYFEYCSQTENIEFKKLALNKALLFGGGEEAQKLIKEIDLQNASDDEREQILSKSIDNGDIEASIQLAEMYIYTDTKKDYHKALKVLEGIENHIKQRYLKGVCFYHLNEYEKAEECFSAETGYVESELYLYKMFVSTNKEKEAIEHIKKAADSDCIPAMYEYGLHLLYGDYVGEDVTMAISYLEKAAQKGYKDAIQKLRYLYTTGYKVSKDINKAMNYRKED